MPAAALRQLTLQESERASRLGEEVRRCLDDEAAWVIYLLQSAAVEESELEELESLIRKYRMQKRDSEREASGDDEAS